MATVTVYSTAKMDELIGATVVGATITGGELVLQLQDATEITVGTVLTDVDDATTSAKGIIEVATDAEVITGTDSSRAITPLGLAESAANQNI